MAFVLRPWQVLFLSLVGWVNREQQQVIDYLRTENHVLRELHGRQGQKCPLPRSDRILGCMLPICHPIGGCLLHRQFGQAAQPFYPAPRFKDPYRTPLPRTSPFR